MSENKNLDGEFMGIARALSILTDDTNTGVGCLIVKDNKIILHGVNQLPNGVKKTNERCEKPLKDKWMVHSERNVIYKAAKEGIMTNGCKMYVTYFPCHECSRAIIQAGIKEVVAPKPDLTHQKWGESWATSIEMLNECNVKVNFYEYEE